MISFGELLETGKVRKTELGYNRKDMRSLWVVYFKLPHYEFEECWYAPCLNKLSVHWVQIGDPDMATFNKAEAYRFIANEKSRYPEFYKARLLNDAWDEVNNET
jgi:hypothetical protein